MASGGSAGVVAALVWRDLVLDFRRKTELLAIALFSLSAGVLSSYIVGGVAAWNPAAPALALSLVMVFLAVYGALTSFLREAEKGTLDGLRLAPLGPELVYAAKLAYAFLVIASQSLLYLAVFALFSQSAAALAPAVIIYTLLATLYMSSASSLVSAMLIVSEAKTILIPAMILVLVLPYMQTLAPSLAQAFAGAPLDPGAAMTIAGMTAFYAALATWLSRFILEA